MWRLKAFSVKTGRRERNEIDGQAVGVIPVQKPAQTISGDDKGNKNSPEK